MDFNKALINGLNIHAPLQTKQITIHRTFPWFRDDVTELKKSMRKCEREHTWIAFKVARSKYRSELYSAKK